jgi:exopolysaccharide biosynthesis polyprenyl glycosylphosphotransferase
MKKTILLLSDLAVLYLSLTVTLLIRYPDKFNQQYSLHLAPFSIIFVLWILVLYITNLYDAQSLRNNIDFYSSLLRANIMAGAISVVFFYLIPFYGLTPKTNLVVFIIVFSVMETISRSIFNSLIETRFKKSVLIVGSQNPQAQDLAEFIKKNPQLGYSLKYIIDGVDNIKTILAGGKIDIVVVSPEAYQMPELIDLFYRSLGRQIVFRNLASFYESVTGRVPLGAINQVWFLENISKGSKRFYGAVKRMSDIILSGFFFLITLPFYPFIILAIKLDSSGPVFYRQQRVGQLGQIFTLVKFRNMFNNAEGATGPVWASENDTRTTRVGKIIRKTRIDEIPQFWNVLRGEMSFVGPRPERPEFHNKLQKEIPFYEERYLVKPGLTGWAQIKHKLDFKGGTTIEDITEKVQHDLYYIKNRSILLDFGIILKTINILLQKAFN